MDEMQDENRGAAEQSSALETEIRQLRDQNKSRLDQLSTLISSLQSVSESVAHEDAALDALEHSARGQFAYLRQSLEETATHHGSLEGRVEELTRALEESERERAALQERAGAAEGESAEAESLRSELAAKSEAVSNLEAEVNNLREQLDGERQAREDAESRLAALEQDTESQRQEAASHQEEVARVQEELAEKNRALEEAQAALDRAQEEQQGVNEEFERLKQAQEQAEAAQEGLKTELMAVQREMEGLREKYRDGLSTEAALALRQQVEETAGQLKTLEAELAEARQQGKKSALAQQLAEAIEESERLEEENHRLKVQLGIAAETSGRSDLDLPPLEPAGVTREEPNVSRSGEDELQRIQQSAQGMSHGPKRVIGQILLDAGVITDEQLETALELQKSNPQQHLGALLAELGFASDEAIAQARASQCDVEYIRFDENTIDPEAASLITKRLATQHACIPISATEREMVLAVTNPMDLLAIEDVERFSNRKVDVVVGTAPDIQDAISRYYWEPE